MQIPSNFWDYKIQVFDNYQTEKPVEIAFMPLALENDVEIGKLILLNTDTHLEVKELTIEQTEYEIGAVEIKGKLNTIGESDKAWIGVVPSGLPHGNNEQNDTYDEVFEYLSALTFS